MKYNKIHSTDLKTSFLSLGTMTFGAQNNYKESSQMLDMAIDNGINFIDTAELYPSPADEHHNAYHTEMFIGKWIKDNKINRNNLIIVSKVIGAMSQPNELSNPARICINPLSKDTVKSSVDKILSRLNTDYIDILLVHWPLRNANFFGKLGYIHKQEDFDVNKHIQSTIETMNELIKSGKIKHYGVSNETAWGLMKYIQIADKEKLPRPVVCQNPYSLLNRSYELGMAEISSREKIGLMAYSVIGGGILTGKHIKGFEKNSRYDLRPDYYNRYTNTESLNATNEYVNLAKKHNICPTQMAISFVNKQQFVLSTITGSTKSEHLQSYIDSLNTELSNKLLAEIEQLHRKFIYPAP